MNTTIGKKTIITHRQNILKHTETHTSKHCTEILQQSKQEVG